VTAARVHGPEVASTTAVVRVMNERAVYEHTRLLGPVSVSQLVAASGLSKATVGLAVAGLERAGLIRQLGHRRGQAGRAPRLYEINPAAGWVLAFDIGRSWIRVALADLAGGIVVRQDVKAQVRSAPALMGQVADLAQAIPREAGLTYGDVTHTILGVPGVYEPERGRFRVAPNLPGLERPGAFDPLRERLGPSFSIENDVNLATLGEQTYGLGQQVQTFVFLSFGTGVGMGIVLDGRLYRGPNGAAGEIAYLPVPDPAAGDSVTTRRHGRLETVAGAHGIVTRARQLGAVSVRSAEEVFRAARGGDPVARQVVAEEAEHVAGAVAAVSAILDPGLVVLGGGIGANGDLLLSPLRHRLGGILRLPPPRVAVSALGRDGVVLGGVAAGLARAREVVLGARLP
jgi:predicted NBD/HSP70 family sugar kinase